MCLWHDRVVRIGKMANKSLSYKFLSIRCLMIPNNFSVLSYNTYVSQRFVQIDAPNYEYCPNDDREKFRVVSGLTLAWQQTGHRLDDALLDEVSYRLWVRLNEVAYTPVNLLH